MTLRSQRSIYGHCLGHGSGTCMFKAAREICTISYEVNECMKHMLLNDILQLVVLLDNYTTLVSNPITLCLYAADIIYKMSNRLVY